METDVQLDQSRGGSPIISEGRSKTPLRMTYEAEVKVFRSKYGGIEEVRRNLGFSRRKMCQLLLVDPSAWTRWTRDESRVPPHVYRSLEWYLALEKKLVNQPDLATLLLKGRSASDLGLTELRLGLESQASTLKRLRWAVIGTVVSFILLGLLLIILR